jgi:predicted N-acetyltransferase YhbS
MHIRKASHSDLQAISDLVLSAFGAAEGPEILQLIKDLLIDESAQPVLSLVAVVGTTVAGHILFSKATVRRTGGDTPAALLAPLAVHRDFQSQGFGGQLVREGLARISASGVGLVFVLGHPGYYPRLGFLTAGVRGFQAPYPIAQKNAGAWMVQPLQPGAIGSSGGQVVCANALADPKFWRE